MSFINVLRKISTFNRYVLVLNNKQYPNLKKILEIKNNLQQISSLSTLTNKQTENVDIFATLDFKVRELQRINKTDILSALNVIESKELPQSEYAQFLIECCGYNIPDILPKNRINLANKIWRTYTDKKINLDINFYNALIQCFIENDMGLSYKEFLNTIKCEPNEKTYQLLLKCACEKGDMNQATEIVNVMKNAGFSANEPVFSSLIIGHLRSSDVANAKNILSTMKIALLNPTALTYTELLRGFAELNDEHNFNSYLEEAVKNTNLNNKNIISIIRSICQSENIQFLQKVKESYSDSINSRSFQISLNNVCTNLINLNKPIVAYETYKCFTDPEIGFLTESDTYASELITEIVKAQIDSSELIKILDDLVTTKRNEYAYFKALNCALNIKNNDLAIFLLKNLHSKNVTLRNHYFWPILIQASKTSETEMFNIFELMCDLNLKIDYETLETYSLQYIENLDPITTIQQLKELNLKVTEIITPISVVLLRTNRIKDIINICEKYKIKLNGDFIIKPLSLLFTKNYDVKNTIDVLKHINENKQLGKYNGQLLIYLFNKPKIDYKQILYLLEGFQQNKMKISSYSLERIENMSRKIENKDVKLKILQISNSIVDFNNFQDNIAPNIPHPRDMNLEQLECHLIELNNKKMETRGILRKLIQFHCRLGNEKRVNELLEDFNKAKYKLSTGLKAGLMDLYIKSENLSLTKKYYDEIKNNDPTFVIDEFKIIDFANLMVAEKKFDEALNLIKFESQKRKIKGGKQIEKNCWQLLNTITIHGDENQIKIFFKTLVDLGFCVPNNILLGPLIRIHLKSDNLNEAVNEYVNCCEKYKCTPLQHEILLKIVDTECSTDLIEKVIISTGKVHGIQSAKVALIASLAATNKINTLKEFLMAQNEDFPSNLLEQHCNQWIKEKNATPLENLMKIKKLFSENNTMIITEKLMKIYYLLNESEKALKLWNELQQMDYSTTKTLKEQLKTLLINNKHPMASKI